MCQSIYQPSPTPPLILYSMDIKLQMSPSVSLPSTIKTIFQSLKDSSETEEKEIHRRGFYACLIPYCSWNSYVGIAERGSSIPILSKGNVLDIVCRNFVNRRIDDMMEMKLEWEDLEYPKFARTGVCTNRTEIERLLTLLRKLLPDIKEITNAGDCYYWDANGLNEIERDIMLSKLETLRSLRDGNVRNILPAFAEAVKLQ
ncbi:unnamed protein product [Allacma fusca]|uniref:Uncharacterized protein n=1 Tax=Allacma fusca TaxID=39272 RepID=A0A8J2PM84_9HEXA|nr:unnamed protein product [Allacma fusca]